MIDLVPFQACSSLSAGGKAGGKLQEMLVAPLCKALTASSSAGFAHGHMHRVLSLATLCANHTMAHVGFLGLSCSGPAVGLKGSLWVSSNTEYSMILCLFLFMCHPIPVGGKPGQRAAVLFFSSCFLDNFHPKGREEARGISLE